jgi:tetratricopeptide (TPR) repeat protein
MRVNNLEGKARSGVVKMNKARNFQTYVLYLVIFSCTLLLASCLGGLKSSKSESSLKADKKVGEMPTEQKKAKLLKSLDRKFENPDAHYKLGQLYQADGLWSQAEYRYNVALSFDPAHREAQAALVRIMIDSGDQMKAGNYYEIFKNQTAGSAAESLKLAEAFKKQELDEQALACYQQALRLAPNSSKINRQIGYYYLSKGQHERARDYLSRSFDLNPNQPDVAGELGRLGVEVRIPRKTVKYTKNLDKIVEPADK